ncbi:MAG: ribokinase [Firmicutes bacterium]|nr:ribokinase [Bacillota bacterium]
MSDIMVIGSASIDFNVTAPRLPAAGETVLGHRFFQVCGGKGANQAVAAAVLTGRVAMVARVGDDAAGRTIVAALQAAGVDTRYVTVDNHAPSGTAHITVGDGGENAIVVVPGSNAQLSRADIDAARPAIASAKVLMLQLEIPMSTALYALQVAAEYRVPTILDPAPAPAEPLPEAFYPLAAWATPNENEAAALCGFTIDGVAAATRAVRLLQQRGVRMPVVKLGAAGSVYAGGHVPAFKVKVVDTTAAGDAFAAGLAVALVEGKRPADALRFASAVGALTTTRYGAQPALPNRAEVAELLAQ